jgi:integrase
MAVLLAEFLDPRPKPQPAYPQPIIQIAYPGLSGISGGEPRRLAGRAAALPLTPYALPSPPAALLRELTVPEVHALWEAATRDGRLAIAALFSGLTLGELAALKWEDADFEARLVKLPGERIQPLTGPLAHELQERASGHRGRGTIVATTAGAALSVDDLAGLVAAAAHDAGIEQAEIIDADTVRHTYVSYLVRQGARLSELEYAVGPLEAASFLHYRNLSPRGPGVPLTAVNLVFPAFRSA